MTRGHWAVGIRAVAAFLRTHLYGRRDRSTSWLLLLLVGLGCASRDQQQEPANRESVGQVAQAIVTTCGSSAVPTNATWVRLGYTMWQNQASFIAPAGSAPTGNLEIEFDEPPGITGVQVNWLCVRAYLRSTSGTISYLGTSTVTAGSHTCGADTCLRRVSYDMSAVTPGTYQVLLAADDQDITFARRNIDVVEATVPATSVSQGHLRARAGRVLRAASTRAAHDACR